MTRKPDRTVRPSDMHPINPADELSDESLNTVAGGQAASLMASASRTIRPGGTLGVGP